MPFSQGGKNDEIVNSAFGNKGLAVTDAADVFARVGANNLENRQILTITNDGPDDVYYGSAGSAIADRDNLVCGQFMSLPIGDCLDIAFKCDTGGTATIKVLEFS